MKRAAFAASAAVCAALGLSGLAAAEIYRYAYCRDAGPLALMLDKKTHAQDYYEHRDSAAQRLREDASCLRLSMLNADGQALRGFYYPCGEKPAKKIAFIIHGYRSEHAETAGMFSDYYRSRGFDLFCVDHAAHGESEGRVIGWSVKESRDCLKWLDYLTDKFGEDVQIVLHGFSMGGATVLKMSGRCPEQVKFIISDSGFSDADGIIRGPLLGMYEPLRLLNCLIGGYDVKEADVRPQLARAKRPILFVHGRLDPTVPFEMGEELYRLCPTEKDCLFTDDTRHIETMHLHPAEYAQKIDAFIAKYIPSDGDGAEGGADAENGEK